MIRLKRKTSDTVETYERIIQDYEGCSLEYRTFVTVNDAPHVTIRLEDIEWVALDFDIQEGILL